MTSRVRRLLQSLGIRKQEEEGPPSGGAVLGGAAAAAAIREPLGGLEMRFDLLNPHAVAFLQRYELDLIRGIDARTREGIRAILIEGFVEGIPPAASARRIRQLIGLLPNQVAAVDRMRENLLEGSVQSLRDVLALDLRDRRFDGSIRRAIATRQAVPGAKIDQMVELYAARLLDQRAFNIAQTETSRAANAGELETWRQAEEQGLIDRTEARRKWIVTQDDRLCPICRPIPGMNPESVKLEAPFQTPVGPLMTPPAHVACRCSMVLVGG